MAYKKKDKVIQNISEFSAYKVLLRMKKKRSPHSVLFCMEPKQDYFVDCIEYKTKSGVVVHDDCINPRTMAGWVSWHKHLGWEEV